MLIIDAQGLHSSLWAQDERADRAGEHRRADRDGWTGESMNAEARMQRDNHEAQAVNELEVVDSYEDTD